jgi:hypothetical protein
VKRLPLYLLLLSYGISFTQGSDTPPPPPPNGSTPWPEEGSIDSQIIFLLLAGVVLGAYYLRNRKKVHS